MSLFQRIQQYQGNMKAKGDEKKSLMITMLIYKKLFRLLNEFYPVYPKWPLCFKGKSKK